MKTGREDDQERMKETSDTRKVRGSMQGKENDEKG